MGQVPVVAFQESNFVAASSDAVVGATKASGVVWSSALWRL